MALVPRFAGPALRIAQRLGRVCYWLGAVLAAMFVIATLVSVVGGAFDLAPLWLILAAICFMGGRALCYILGGE